MFEEFKFSSEQIKRYYQAAAKDLRLASLANEPELAFYACYNISEREVKFYIDFCRDLLKKLDDYLFPGKML